MPCHKWRNRSGAQPVYQRRSVRGACDIIEEDLDAEVDRGSSEEETFERKSQCAIALDESWIIQPAAAFCLNAVV